MKVSEFEAKLSEVEDAKLLLMLSTSRREGPEVAVKMILAEAEKRGLPNLDPVIESADDEMPVSPALGEKLDKVEKIDEEKVEVEGIEFAGSENDPSHMKEDFANTLEDAPTGGAKWLAEESSSSKGMMIKIIGALAVVGVLIFVILKVTQH